MTETLLTPQNNNFVGAKFYNSAWQLNIASATQTNINFDSTSYDVGSNFTTGSNPYYTIPTTGYYFIGLNVRWSSVVDQKRYYCVIANGDYEGVNTELALGINTASGVANLTVNCSTGEYLTAGDKIYFGVYHDTGTSAPDISYPEKNTYGFVHQLATLGK